MRKVFAIAALGLLTLAIPALAVVPANTDGTDQTAAQGSGIRSVECPGTVVWDTGMYDEYTIPAGCSSAASAGCFVNAINDGGYPQDGRRVADDFFGLGGDPITAVKFWARFNTAGYDYHAITGGSVHGFCVKFYAPGADFWCPDGTIAGEEAIGAIAYDQYCTNFVEEEIFTGMVRNFAYCITLPQPFYADYGVPYWFSVSGDFDFTLYDPDAAYTQLFDRMYPGVGNSQCEACWWDTWSGTEVPWNAVSVGVNIPCWTGWDQAFKLYSSPYTVTGACCIGDQGECQVTTEAECATLGGAYQGNNTVCDPNPCPIVPTEPTTWGKVKANFR